jgi:hypothetical protein
MVLTVLNVSDGSQLPATVLEDDGFENESEIRGSHCSDCSLTLKMEVAYSSEVVTFLSGYTAVHFSNLDDMSRGC